MTNNTTLSGNWETGEKLAIFLPVLLLCAFTFSLNLATVCLILQRPKLRRPYNYPIMSILIGSALQSSLIVPLYIFKRLWLTEHPYSWLCDSYRFPYFFCEHLLKLSLLHVSIDRLLATKFPFFYERYVTKKVAATVVLLSWIVVLVVDCVPFLPFGKKADEEGCTYVPTRVWSIAVIKVFNVLILAVVIVNYAFIWKTAARLTFKDEELRRRGFLMNSPALSPVSLRKDEMINNDSTFIDPVDSLTTPVSLTLSPTDNTQLSPYTNTLFLFPSPTKQTSKPQKLRIALGMKATKTSFLLLLVYLVCWGPLGIFYLIDNYCDRCISRESRLSSARLLVKVVSFTSSVFLPLVYCWRTEAFSREVRKLVCLKKI